MVYLNWVMKSGDEKASLSSGGDGYAKPRDDTRILYCLLRVELYGACSETLAGLPKAVMGFFGDSVFLLGLKMTLKNVFESRNWFLSLKQSGQAVFEYMILFVVVTMVVIIVFGGVNPGHLAGGSGAGLTQSFSSSVSGAVSHLEGLK